MRNERGFTLVEMLVAIVVLAVGIAGTLAALGAISSSSGAAAEYDRAALLAERQLAEIEAQEQAPSGEDSGDFGEEYPGYQWEQEVLATDVENLVEVRLTVSWGNEKARRSIQVSTYLLQEQSSAPTTTPA
jgi:prepilin-type N-terminal cleavage/methylation domain-containing protein